MDQVLNMEKLKSPQEENKKNTQKTYSIYGKAKLLSTKFLLKLSKEQNFPCAIIRLIFSVWAKSRYK